MLTAGNGKTIETRTLDSFNFDKVDLIKIDVEGLELSVLDGTRETIGKFHPKIILETHTKELYKKSIEFLKDFNYNLKFNKKIEGNDYFKDVNLLFLSIE
ncbi:MAG: FkbM family methyltransferase [Thermoplasmata archaeon]